MASGTLVSRVLGLASKSLLTLLLGASALNLAANAFDVANKMPNLIYALVAGGALNAVLVPQIVRADKDGARGREFLDRLFTMATVGLLGLTVVLTLAAGPLVDLYTGGMGRPGARPGRGLRRVVHPAAVLLRRLHAVRPAAQRPRVVRAVHVGARGQQRPRHQRAARASSPCTARSG